MWKLVSIINLPSVKFERNSSKFTKVKPAAIEKVIKKIMI